MIEFRCSYLGTIKNKISMKVCVHVYIWAPLICLGEVVRAGNLESYGICVMNIFRNCQMFCRAGRPFWISTNTVQECQYLHILVSTQYNVFHFRRTSDCVVLSPDFSLHFLFTNEMRVFSCGSFVLHMPLIGERFENLSHF